MALTEDKSRIRHHGIAILRAHLKLVCACPSDLALYITPKYVAQEHSALMKVELDPSTFIERSKERFVGLFRENYGPASRGQDPSSLGPVKAARAAQRAAATIPKRIFTKSVKRTQAVSERVRNGIRTAGAKAMVGDMRKEQSLRAQGVEAIRESILGVTLHSNDEAQGLKPTPYQVLNLRKPRDLKSNRVMLF